MPQRQRRRARHRDPGRWPPQRLVRVRRRELADRKPVVLRAQATQTAALVAPLGEERFADRCAQECSIEAGPA